MRISVHKAKLSLLMISVFLVLMDRPLMYFIESTIGMSIPTNRLLVVLIVPLVLYSLKQINISANELVFVAMTLIAFIIGVIFLDEFHSSQILSIIGVIFPFMLGVVFTQHLGNKNIFRFLLYISIFPAFIGIIAVYGLLPNVFNVVNQIHMVEGSLVNRPEVFTDQNFHIMYVFWLIPLTKFITTRNDKILWFVLVVGNLIVLSSIQTRSGLMYYLACFVISMYLFKTLKIKHVLVLLLLVLVGLPFISLLFDLLLKDTDIYNRFNNDNGTGSHRIDSFLFWFYHLFDMKYWIPYGNSEFDFIYGGNLPHSNITAFYLNGGMLSLIGYFRIIVIPLCMLALIRFKGLLDLNFTYVFICSITMLLIQTSLNVPYNEQIWFWAGLSIGVVNCILKKQNKLEE